MADVETNEKKPSISYWSKDPIVCPFCEKKFKREIMLSGSGRMNAGELTDELHRNFIPSQKYGAIYPLVYEVAICPNCFAALSWADMTSIKDAQSITLVSSHKDERIEQVKNIFPDVDFTVEKTLAAGAAAYFASLLTYDYVTKELCPSMKSAICALRAAWLTKELDGVLKGENYDYVSSVFYQKALFFYNEAILAETERKERSAELSNYGPDMDKNYGWDGAIYIRGLLEYKYGQTEDQQARLKSLAEAKISIARMFGLGKSSKSKPGPLLEAARDLYNTLGKILKDDDM